MASIFQEAKLNQLVILHRAEARAANYQDLYEDNRDRVYSLAFWMTYNELAAEELATATFCRAFTHAAPDSEIIDRALVSELRELAPLGSLTLSCRPAAEVLNVRRRVKRPELERAVVTLPATERMIFLLHDVESYDHARIARTLGVTEAESRTGLLQARLRMRELMAQ
jgi:RNA polymerase sigma-70 factor (ECF subfamily)